MPKFLISPRDLNDPSKHCDVGRVLACVGYVMATSCIGKLIDFDIDMMSVVRPLAVRHVSYVGMMSSLQQLTDVLTLYVGAMPIPQ